VEAPAVHHAAAPQSHEACPSASFLDQMCEEPSEVSDFLPPCVLRRHLFGEEELATDDASGTLAASVREELTMLAMLIRRTHTPQFRTWCDNNSADEVAIRQAAEDVQARLMSVLAACSADVVHVV